MGVAAAGSVFLSALGAGLAGANPDNFFPIFLYFLGFSGPVFLFGLYLAIGGWNVSRQAHLVFLGLGLGCVAISLAARSTL